MVAERITNSSMGRGAAGKHIALSLVTGQEVFVCSGTVEAASLLSLPGMLIYRTGMTGPESCPANALGSSWISRARNLLIVSAPRVFPACLKR